MVLIWRDNIGGRLLNAALVALVVLVSVAGLRVFGVTAALDRLLWETRFALDQRPVSGDIVFVDIDASSLAEIGHWPLPRRIYARLIDQLIAGGAQDMVFDIDFSAESNALDDMLLAQALKKAGNASLAVFTQAASGAGAEGTVLNMPHEQFIEHAWPVVVMVPMEADSRIWRNLYGHEINGTTELSVASLIGEHTGGVNGSFFLDYSISIDQIARISLVDVLDGTSDPSLFDGKKIIIGASALELRDLFPVPVHGILPGALIQALGAETLLQKRALEPKGEGVALLVAALICGLLFMTKIDGWSIKLVILGLAAFAIEAAAISVQSTEPILVPAASAYILLFLVAGVIVLRELGFHKLLAQVANINQRNSERMLGQVFDDSFDAILVLDRDCLITAANRTARQLFDNEKLAGCRAQAVLPNALVEEALAVLGAVKDCIPVPQLLVLTQEGARRRLIEYVVTKTEKTIAPNGRSGKTKKTALACVTCRDVTDERESAARLDYLARFDPITGLLNRSGFESDLAERTKSACVSANRVLLLQFAISNLDQIVATLGFSYGDRLRQSIAARLKTQLAEDISWAAVTADVFAGVRLLAADQDSVLQLVEDIQKTIGGDHVIDGAHVSARLNIGYVIADGDMAPDSILKRAGNALSLARRDSQNQVVCFQNEMDTALQRRRSLEGELFKAIVRDELRLDYQPLVNLIDGSIFGVEALLRWDSRSFGPVSPAEFIPIAEETGYIVELGSWALNRGMKEVQSLPGALRLSVNVSPLQFFRGNLLETVAEALERSGFAANRLDLEVTETLFVDESPDLKRKMEELQALGCRFSLDDFGTGYSSLAYITDYPFSKIKLDKSFVRDTLEREEDTAVIEAVLLLAQGYGMTVLVEGVETAEQALRLHELGCRCGQGYYFGRPTGAADMAAQLVQAA